MGYVRPFTLVPATAGPRGGPRPTPKWAREPGRPTKPPVYLELLGGREDKITTIGTNKMNSLIPSPLTAGPKHGLKFNHGWKKLVKNVLF